MAGLITVGIDGSERAREALRFALAEARLRHAKLRVVTAWRIPPLTANGVGAIPVHDLLYEELGASARQLLDAELDAVDAGASRLEIEPRVVRGNAADALVKSSADADMLVVGSHGRGTVAGLLLGSVSEACIHHAACPVAVVHAFKTARHGRIVVGVDGSRGSRAAFAWAADECRLRNATLHTVVAYEDQWGSLAGRIANSDILLELEATVAHDAKRTLTSAIAAVPQGVVATGETVRSSPARALLEKATDADLLVVGSRGHGGMASLLLGSVSRRCAADGPNVTVVVPRTAIRARKPRPAVRESVARDLASAR
jgi:nucleotide-binding universal stress UspA family protein